MTAPTNGATVHLSPNSATVNISSDRHADFFRYDSWGSYDPVLTCQLSTTSPNATGYQQIDGGSKGFQLPQQVGDVYTVFYLTHAQPYTGSFASAFSFTFSNQAFTYYPATTIVSTAVASATATYSP